MSRLFGSIMSLLLLAGACSAVSAKQCRDAHGKFTKCAPVVTSASKRCRDASGKFTKCSPAKKM